MAKKRGLGRSLDALLAYTTNTDTAAPHLTEVSTAPVGDALRQLSVHDIHRGKYQPRRDMDTAALEELANSIRTQGIIQPIIVRPDGDQYEIIAGERRWRAAQLAGLTEVPVVIRDIPDEAAIAIALIENIQRENLNPIEEAIAVQRLIDEFEMTHQQIADALGKSRAGITNLLRLLTLADEVRDLLERGRIEMGHARTLITLPESVQLEAANLIVARGLSVRETEHLVRQLQTEPVPKAPKVIDPDIANLQTSLAKQLKMKVAIQCNAKGKGKLVIHYRNLTELDDLIAQFQTA